MTDHAANLAAALEAATDALSAIATRASCAPNDDADEADRELGKIMREGFAARDAAALALADYRRAAQAPQDTPPRYRTASTPGLIIDDQAPGGPRLIADAMHPDFARLIVDALNAQDRRQDSSQARPADAAGVLDSRDPLASVRDHIRRNPDAFDPI